MLTSNEAPWIEYLEIDEETGKRRLREDTPQDIRARYEEYCAEQRKSKDKPFPK